MVLSNGTPNNKKKKKINTKNSGLRHVSTKPSAQRRSDQFGEIESADTRAGKFPLVSMGVRAECPACADTGARTPTGTSGNFW